MAKTQPLDLASNQTAGLQPSPSQGGPASNEGLEVPPKHRSHHTIVEDGEAGPGVTGFVSAPSEGGEDTDGKSGSKSKA